MGQILIITSVALTFLAAVLGFVNRGKLAESLSKLTAAEASLVQKQNEIAKIQDDLKKTSDTLATTSTEKEQLNTQLASAQTELQTVKTQTTELSNKITSKEEEITKLNSDLQAKIAELEQIKSSGGTTPDQQTADNQAALAEKEAVITELESKLDSTRGELETLKKEKQDRQTLKMRNGLEGRILAVNQAWNFVVLNVGDRNGVLSNAEMLVKRGTQLLGKVRITSVEPSTSIADIVAHSVPAGLTIQPGDSVIYQAIED